MSGIPKIVLQGIVTSLLYFDNIPGFSASTNLQLPGGALSSLDEQSRADSRHASYPNHQGKSLLLLRSNASETVPIDSQAFLIIPIMRFIDL